MSDENQEIRRETLTQPQVQINNHIKTQTQEGTNDGKILGQKRRKKGPIALCIITFLVVCTGIGFWVWHEQPSFCGTVCHDTMGSYLESYECGNCLVNQHASVNVVCLDCHEADLSTQIAELQVQLSGNYRLPLAKMVVDDAFCLRDGCHTREAIVEKTSTYIAGDKESLNPHTITFSTTYGDTESPHEVGGENIACSTCHTGHRESLGIEYCYDSCHHTKTFKICYDCHEHR